MRILLVAWAFPPYNVIGAVRVGKLAKALAGFGHDVRILTAAPLPHPRTLPLESPAACVSATPWRDVNAPVRRLAGAGPAGRIAAGGFRVLTNWPDAQVGWLRAAVRAGCALAAEFAPQMIYSSAPPFTGHMVADRLAQASGAPWVAEFRDLYAANPYSSSPGWRRAIERVIERRTLVRARALVTVSEPLAETLRAAHGKPVAVILNGYDTATPRGAAPQPEPSDKLVILYTGTIYPGRRDPSVLFEAVARMGDAGRAIELRFCGQDLRGVTALAERHGVTQHTRILPVLPHAEAVAAQAAADALLLLLWNDPREAGVFTGKLFEYAGAARPILTLGWDSGVAANLVRERGLGFVSNDPAAIAAQLRAWIDEKKAKGCVAGPPDAAREGLSRAEQFARLDAFLREIVPAGATAGGP